MTGPVRVVVVEDSAVQRAHLVKILETTSAIKVVGQAADAREVLAVARASRPDVVTMDLHLPGGGGVEAIRSLMQTTPVPILVLSVAAGPVAARHATIVLDALAAGALEALPKPPVWTREDGARLRSTVMALRGARAIPVPAAEPAVTPADLPVVAIVASTGGPGSIARVLADLAGVKAPVLVVQHLHSDFNADFVSWLGTVSPLPVVVATEGTLAKAGVVYVAPADAHLRIDVRRRLRLDPDPPAVHRPSGDELLRSVARSAGRSGVGVLLTGMGEDGAAGLLCLRQAGGVTISQDEATCAVFGMPAAAQRLGASTAVLGLPEIGRAVKLAAHGLRP